MPDALPDLLLQLLAASREPIVIVDDAWRCYAVNRAACQFLGQPVEVLEYRTLFEGWIGVHCDWNQICPDINQSGRWQALDESEHHRIISWKVVPDIAPNRHWLILQECFPSIDDTRKHVAPFQVDSPSRDTFLTTPPEQLPHHLSNQKTGSRDISFDQDSDLHSFSNTSPASPLRSKQALDVSRPEHLRSPLTQVAADTSNLLETLPFCLVYLDPQFRFKAVNSAYKKRWNCSLENVYGRLVSEVWGKAAAAILTTILTCDVSETSTMSNVINLDLIREKRRKINAPREKCEVDAIPLSFVADVSEDEWNSPLITPANLRAITINRDGEKPQPAWVGVSVDFDSASGRSIGDFRSTSNDSLLSCQQSSTCIASNPSDRGIRGYYLILFDRETPSTSQQSEVLDLRQQAEIFQAAIERSPDGIMRLDCEGHFLYVNPTLEEWRGIPLCDFLGKTNCELGMSKKLVQQWKTVCDLAIFTQCEQIIETEETWMGCVQIFLSRVIPEINNSGEVTSILIVSREITTIKRAQSSLIYQAEREYTLRRISQNIRQSLDLDCIFASTVTEVQQNLQADRVMIYRFNESLQTEIVWESTHSNYPITLRMRQRQPPLIADCFDFFLHSDRAWIVADMNEQDWRTCLFQGVSDTGARSKMVATIAQESTNRSSQTSTQVWGLLVVHACTTQRQWQSDELDLLQEVAEQLAIAIQHAELLDQVNHQSQHLTQINAKLAKANARLKELSEIDGLTQIANRRRFDLTLKQAWNRLLCTQAPISLILFDVDHFKAYNDTHGHPAGDSCLIQIARTAAKQVSRSIDLLARYGGEEFVVILPETTIMGAIFVAESLRQAVQDLNIFHSTVDNQRRCVTISLGVACQVPKDDQTYQTLIESADQALYRAKNAGRNIWMCDVPDATNSS
jgi:diguanylate cyclase (GGDEF)-like protein/PAS domain S-box-containing protein